MNPRLAAMAGPLEGTVIPLIEDEVSLGRDRSNLIWINDVSVSRRHCLIKCAGDVYHITDLKSYNGTRVNGTPVGEAALDHGDMIAVGDSLFLFLRHDDDEEAVEETAPVEVNEERCEIQTTAVLRIEDAIYLQPDKVLAALPTTARIARGLNTLLSVSSAVNSISEVEALERRLLELLFEIVPAQRGAILLAREASDEFASVFGRDRLGGGAQPVQVSRTIINQVRRDGVAILCNNVLESEALQSDSLIASRIQSLICVPLMLFSRISGVLYLDTSDRSVMFDPNHLQLITAIGSIAAIALRNARNIERLEVDNRRLQLDLNIKHNMVGESAGMRAVLQFIARAGPTDSTVLIQGESGTGKELAARAIHKASARQHKPFVAINCAALTETLLESELFGHEKGAFTGAIAQKKGKIEVADGGTVFLDEVGELAPVLQSKLLRVLQEREFERVGGVRPVKVDIRLVAATNKNLESAVQTGGFRQDLYYRINVVRLTMPLLRERREDILLLASYFVSKHAQKCKRRVTAISPEARTCLLNYDWPGNIRELENAIERAIVLGSTDEILAEDLPESLLEVATTSGSPVASYTHAVKEAKRQIVLDALDAAGGNYIEAARSLGIHRNNLHRLIRNLDLKHISRK